jgi:putative transposase
MSRRHRRTAVQIAELRAREARRRNDWLHKRTTTDLAKGHGLIVVEDLGVANMTRSAGAASSARLGSGRRLSRRRGATLLGNLSSRQRGRADDPRA